MTWQQRYFKGKKVWAKVDAHGELLLEDGRVPMKYSAAEDAKIYGANPRNLSGPLDASGAPEKASAKKDGAAEKAASPKKERGAGTKLVAPQLQTSAPQQVSTQTPESLQGCAPPAKGVIEVYTDGACSGNPGPCGYGLLMRDGAQYREISQYLGIGTNNIAELTAIGVALENIADKTRPVRIYTDSSYSIGVLTKGWKAKANVELIQGIRAQLAEFEDLRLIKVKGHAGHPLNERADTLATSSLAQRA